MKEKAKSYFEKPHFDVTEFAGKRVHFLKVIGLADRVEGEREWKLSCLCDCGRITRITPSQFRRGAVKSCGRCNTKAGTRDGRSLRNPRLYSIWKQMIGRCENKHHKTYARYGGRGITVCEEWHDYCKFEAWTYSVGGKLNGMSLDRIDNDGPYSPENCRWATKKEQARNQSRTIVISFKEKTQSLADWAEELGMKWVTLHNRYVRGWSVERMLTEPVHKK